MLEEPLTSDNLPDLSKLAMTTLEPGTAYRFRLAAINSCGVGEFGEVIENAKFIRNVPNLINQLETVVVVQNLLAWFPWCTISNQNL